MMQKHIDWSENMYVDLKLPFGVPTKHVPDCAGCKSWDISSKNILLDGNEW